MFMNMGFYDGLDSMSDGKGQKLIVVNNTRHLYLIQPWRTFVTCNQE